MRTVRVAISAAAVLVLWAGLAYDVSRPADERAYHRTMVQVAAAAHDAAQAGRLIAEQERAQHVTGPYARTAFDDAAKALAGAQKKFVSQAPPDDRTARLRDELRPLLAEETIALGDASRAADDGSLRSGARRLADLAKRLDDLRTAWQQ